MKSTAKYRSPPHSTRQSSRGSLSAPAVATPSTRGGGRRALRRFPRRDISSGFYGLGWTPWIKPIRAPLRRPGLIVSAAEHYRRRRLVRHRRFNSSSSRSCAPSYDCDAMGCRAPGSTASVLNAQAGSRFLRRADPRRLASSASTRRQGPASDPSNAESPTTESPTTGSPAPSCWSPLLASWSEVEAAPAGSRGQQSGEEPSGLFEVPGGLVEVVVAALYPGFSPEEVAARLGPQDKCEGILEVAV